ncbi:aminomethyltransferase [Paenibacillus mucilaginosus]|uniref:glycine cleavage system aminomethyltransferase GcvT n=1 Tax=Paenibacillus mucilaginosus TaxID=61624 RepID=UPI003D2487D5
MKPLKRTPLYPFYEAHGARCIDFGGWDLPVQYAAGLTLEHEAVRQRAGLFDVSHMGEFLVTGPRAASWLQRLTTNDIGRLKDGEAQYTLLCYPDGGTVDDLLVYRLAPDRFMLVVNASNIAKDFEWLQRHQVPGAHLEDRSEATALLALQGPRAAAILAQAADGPLPELRPFAFAENVPLCGGIPALVSRTGYTGEDGFELYLGADDAGAVWQGLLQAGEPHGLLPAGLGARDTLRFEARLPLYGQELSPQISPLEAGLGPFVRLAKEDFIGREALLLQKELGLRRKLAGIEMIDRGIPRAHYPVHSADGRPIGEVTTGTQSPTLKRNLGLALIEAEQAALGTELLVEIRGKLLRARVVPTPFYRKKSPTP